MLRISALILAFTLLQGVPTALPNGQTIEPGESIINLAECKQETKIVYSKFGSEKIVVKGRRGSRCVIERTSETEGSYIKHECRIPISRGKLNLAEKAEPAAGKNAGKCEATSLSNVSKYCKVVKTGNVLLEGR
jgi:hypothetical protein